jgi:hypothetical protein
MSRREVLAESLEATPRDLARLLRPVAPEAAVASPDGGWGIAATVAHLAHTERLMLARFRRILGEQAPTVDVIEDPGEHDLARPLADLLADFVAARAETVTFLRGLEQRDWGRPLVHPRHGARRLRDEVQALVAHDNEHLERIVALRG